MPGAFSLPKLGNVEPWRPPPAPRQVLFEPRHRPKPRAAAVTAARQRRLQCGRHRGSVNVDATRGAEQGERAVDVQKVVCSEAVPVLL
eukprot:366020-Chlamydomonas_euryale.AAC.11